MMDEKQHREEELEGTSECDGVSADEIENLEEALENELAREMRPEIREEKDMESAAAFTAEKQADLVHRRGRSRAKGAGSAGGEKHREPEHSGKSGDRKKKILIAAGIAAAVILAAGGSYAGMAQRYKGVYFPNTQINGMDVSGRTVAEVKDLISEGTNGYVLTLIERGDGKEQITGESIGMHPEFNGALEQLLAAQNPYQWGFYQVGLRSDVHELEAMIVYEAESLEQQIKALSCLQPENQTEPENARISDYVSGQGYTIIPETEGTAVQEEALRVAVAEGIRNLQEQLSLEEAGVYKEADITSEDAALKERLDAMNRYAGVTVTYRFGDKTEVLNGDRIHEWIVTDEAGNVSVDSGQVIRYVEELAAEHNTAHKAKNLKTSYGKTIQVKGGSYGWKLNQSAEADELAAILRSGESQTREPIYSQKAASHGDNDYGNTYVEVNLTAQHLYFYKDGKLVVDSDFVSGNLSKGWGTPAGIYGLTYKQRDAVLKGENYRTPVDYWMPFNGGIGLHDATWRSSFGGTIYKTNGSHGCINLPHDVAKKIFENISAGDPVICYQLEGTERGSSSTKPAEPTTEAPTQAPTEPSTEAPTQAPTETPTQAPAETADQPVVKPTQPAPEVPVETADAPIVKPTEAPVPTEAPTQAPAGPGSDKGNTGKASGPAA